MREARNGWRASPMKLGAATEATARVTRVRGLGREAAGGGAEGGGGQAHAGASAAGGASGEVAGACHVAGARGDSFVAIAAGVRVREGGDRAGARVGVSGRALFGADGSHPPDRRGRPTGRTRPGIAGPRRALREADQPRARTPRERVEQSVPRACAAHAAGDAARAGLRPPQLPEAPAGAARGRSAQLGALVQRVACAAACPRR
jgi:hypothetical protein